MRARQGDINVCRPSRLKVKGGLIPTACAGATDMPPRRVILKRSLIAHLTDHFWGSMMSGVCAPV